MARSYSLRRPLRTGQRLIRSWESGTACTVADFTAKVRDMTGQAGYTIRNAAYDLRKLRGKHLAGKPGEGSLSRTDLVPAPSTAASCVTGTLWPAVGWWRQPVGATVGLPGCLRVR